MPRRLERQVAPRHLKDARRLALLCHPDLVHDAVHENNNADDDNGRDKDDESNDDDEEDDKPECVLRVL